ncbi:hypothetical protein, partial [Ardenticatena maritima]
GGKVAVGGGAVGKVGSDVGEAIATDVDGWALDVVHAFSAAINEMSNKKIPQRCIDEFLRFA